MRTVHNIEPSIVTYNIILKALLQLNKIDETKTLYKHLHNVGIKPNQITYGILLYGFCKNGRLEAAVSLYNYLDSQLIKITTPMHNALIEAFCKEEKWEEVLKQLQTMSKQKLQLDDHTRFILQHFFIGVVTKSPKSKEFLLKLSQLLATFPNSVKTSSQQQ